MQQNNSQMKHYYIGDESQYSQRNKGDAVRLRQLQRACFQLCAAIDEQHAIAVYNHAFAVKQFLQSYILKISSPN